MQPISVHNTQHKIKENINISEVLLPALEIMKEHSKKPPSLILKRK